MFNNIGALNAIRPAHKVAPHFRRNDSFRNETANRTQTSGACTPVAQEAKRALPRSRGPHMELARLATLAARAATQ